MASSIQPYVRLAMHHTYLKGYFIERHIWDHEIIFIDRGKMKITIEDKVYLVEKDDCIILRPNVYHKIEWAGEDCDQPHVHFDLYEQDDSSEVNISMKRQDLMTQKELTYFREDYFNENKITIPPVIKLRQPYIVRNLLFQLIDEFTYKLKHSDLYLQGTLSLLIGAVLRDYHFSQVDSFTPYWKELDDLIIYMAKNVDANLSLEDLMEQSKLGKWNLIRLFKQRYGITPMKYMARLKYNQAKNYLQYSSYTIKEISYKMNFESPQSFSRWFKMMDGNSPGVYHRLLK